MRLLQNEERVEISIPECQANQENGAALDAARHVDRAWREVRRKRTRQTLDRTFLASDVWITGVDRVLKGLGILFVASAFVTAGYGVLGAKAVPDAVQLMLVVSLLGGITTAALKGVSHLLSWGMTRSVRLWAEHNAVDLSLRHEAGRELPEEDAR